MGYTHYWDYKNPISEIAEIEKLRKAEYSRLRKRVEPKTDIWDEMAKFDKQFQTKKQLNERVEKHIKAFKSAAKDIKHLLKNLPEHSFSAGGYHSEENIIIKGGLGKGKPTVNKNKIWLNGDGEKDLDHETFAIDLFEALPLYYEDYQIEKGVSGFCKTARKPYDLVVCVSLLILKEHLGEDFDFSSDGGLEDWEQAILLYIKLFNRAINKDFLKKFAENEDELKKFTSKTNLYQNTF